MKTPNKAKTAVKKANSAYVLSDFEHKLRFGREDFDDFAAARSYLGTHDMVLLLLIGTDGSKVLWTGTHEQSPWSLDELVDLCTEVASSNGLGRVSA